LPFIGDVKPLDAKEAASLETNLITALHAIFMGADQIISMTNQRKSDAYIWQGIDDEDCRFLVSGLLRVAQKSPAAAWAVRGISETSTMLRTGMILLPRFMQTVQFYAENGGLVLPR